MFRGNEIDLVYVVMVSAFAIMLRKPILLPPHNQLNILFYVYSFNFFFTVLISNTSFIALIFFLLF